MKQISLLFFILIFFFTKTLFAQPDFKKGFIVTANNETIEDSLRFWKGKLITVAPGKGQKIYSPGTIKRFSIGTMNCISYSNDFYKEVTSGITAGLYQKLSDNSGELMYNGTEPIRFLETTHGAIGDLYILTDPGRQLVRISKKDFKNYFSKLLVANNNLFARMRWESLSYRQVKKVLEVYNSE